MNIFFCLRRKSFLRGVRDAFQIQSGEFCID